MHDLEKYRALVDSRPTRFGEAVNRYLGAVGYRPEQPVAMPARTGEVIGLGLVGADVAAQHPGPVLVVRVPSWPPGPGFGERPIVLAAERADLNTPSAVFALAEARVRRCDLVVLRAQPDGAAVGCTDTVEGVRVHYRTVPADPVTALIDVSNRAAAIVLGRRGAAGSPVALLGSVSRAALQRAYCPVFLVD